MSLRTADGGSFDRYRERTCICDLADGFGTMRKWSAAGENARRGYVSVPNQPKEPAVKVKTAPVEPRAGRAMMRRLLCRHLQGLLGEAELRRAASLPPVGPGSVRLQYRRKRCTDRERGLVLVHGAQSAGTHRLALHAVSDAAAARGEAQQKGHHDQHHEQQQDQRE